MSYGGDGDEMVYLMLDGDLKSPLLIKSNLLLRTPLLSNCSRSNPIAVDDDED